MQNIKRKTSRTVSTVRGSQPRKSGLLNEIRWHRGPPERYPYAHAVGERIGKDLTVIGHLAAGRSSELYQVWSTERWCPFTFKVLATKAREDRTARAALRREGRILRRLDHPNLVRIFGDGEDEGLSFLLLEYLEGPSLFDVLETVPGRRMAVADAVRTVIHAGSAVVHMHRAGFLHLDLKPANLLLRGGVPVLLDLNTARPVHPARAPRSSLGTTPYMSPEQVLRHPPGFPADVYGLGAITYELLSGRWPFEDVYDGKDRRSGLERQYPQIGDIPAPPLRRFRPEITRSLDRAVMKSLARNPEDRFPTVTELLIALSAELKDSVSLWPKRAHPEPDST